jgi:hypothetical protein
MGKRWRPQVKCWAAESFFQVRCASTYVLSP